MATTLLSSFPYQRVFKRANWGFNVLLFLIVIVGQWVFVNQRLFVALEASYRYQAWLSNHPENYTMTTKAWCHHCVSPVEQTVVKDDKKVFRGNTRNAPTIEELFVYLCNALQSDSQVINVRYDAQWNYPSIIAIGVGSQNSGIEVLDFQTP